MSTLHRYLLPVEQTHWKVEGATEVSFTWDYDARSDELLQLYAKGKQQQWDAERRIDWTPRGRPRRPDADRRQDAADVRHAAVGQALGAAALGPALPHADVPAVAVPARRAGRADLRRQDRAGRADHRVQVLRRDPGHGRGAPRRGLPPAADGEVPLRLPDHRPAQGAAGEGDHRPALGFHLPRHAGADRGARAVGFPALSRLRQEPALLRGQRLRDAGRGAPRRLRPPRAARLLPAVERSRARRARGFRDRGRVRPARPLQPARDVAADRHRPGGRGRGDGRGGEHDALPHAPFQPHRAHGARHRAVERRRCRRPSPTSAP